MTLVCVSLQEQEAALKEWSNSQLVAYMGRAVNRTVYGYGRICTVSIRVWAIPYFTRTYIFSPFDGTVR